MNLKMISFKIIIQKIFLLLFMLTTTAIIMNN